ncbi:hypothetical protein [Microseira sp. BLCC-F43]|uniref:hypothetical protein n=1 Tax=Microseira sp. BLCC-F43 TaxID=3153602 RepID=UPI0035B8ED45
MRSLAHGRVDWLRGFIFHRISQENHYIEKGWLPLERSLNFVTIKLEPRIWQSKSRRLP